jgi:hypothetical protein
MRDGLDCPVAALLAMTKSRVAGEVVSSLFRENLNPTLSLRARAWQSSLRQCVGTGLAPYAQRIKSIRDLLHRAGGVVIEARLSVLSFQEVKPLVGVGLVQVAIASWVGPEPAFTFAPDPESVHAVRLGVQPTKVSMKYPAVLVGAKSPEPR